MKKSTGPRVRLSLECSPETKRLIEEHGAELSEWSIIGAIRHAVRRSKKFFDLEQQGTLLLKRPDGGIEAVPKDEK